MTTAERLEGLRAAIRAENISWGELAELQGLADQIPAGDVELLEWAGVPEFPEDNPTPEEDDAYVRDGGSSGYSVSMCGRARGWIADMDDAVRHLAAEMEATSYFPNVWYVNDHGNVTLLLVTIDPELGVTWDFTDVSYV